MVLKRQLVERAERKPQAVPLPLNDLILGADLEKPRLDALANGLPEDPLDDYLEPVCKPVLQLHPMGLPQPLVLSWPCIERAMFLDLGLAFLHLRRVDEELSAYWRSGQGKQECRTK